MRRLSLNLMIFYLLAIPFNAYSQQDSISDWQEQVLSQIDVESFSDAAYSRLIEMLGDLELNRNDTVFPARIKQNVILGSNMRLNYEDGNPFNHTLRYKAQYGKTFSTGFVLNKDIGERFQRHFPWFDSHSLYATYTPENTQRHDSFRVAKTIVGHYRVRLGSGLLLNQAFSLGKNIQHDAFMKSGTTFSAHSSTDEYNYMQGAIADFRFSRFCFIPFVSFKHIDAVVANDTITSIPTDGYHRTQKEIDKRNTAAVVNAGLHAAYSGNWYNIGMNILFTRFSHPFYRPIRTYNIYYYRGQELFQGSIDYHARRFGFQLRGETAVDQDMNIASVNQIAHNLGEDWNASLSYRFYGRQYQQLYASSVSEASSMQGEQGATLALSGSPLPYWTCSLMLDYFNFANIQYGYKIPFSGFESLIMLQYARKNSNLKISYRLKSKQAFRHSLDAVFLYSAPFGLNLKSQLRSKIYSPRDIGGYSIGYAAAQSLGWAKDSSPLSADLQLCWYDAADYDTRIYLSEKNVLYGFGIPMLYGRGIRYSVCASYRIGRKIVFDFKYASGKQSNLWMQVRVNY